MAGVLDYPEPTIYAAPLFIATVAIEALVLRTWRRRGRDVVGYERKDTWASLAMGIGSLATVTAINAGVFALATWLWAHRFVDLGRGV